MKRKQMIFIFVGIVTIIAIAVGVVFFINDVKTTTAKNAIAIPNKKEFIDSWQEVLPILQEKLNIPQINLVLYEDADSLQQILAYAKKNELILAEVPVSYEYDFSKLIDKNLSAPIELKMLPSRVLPGALITAKDGATSWYRIIPNNLIAGIFEAEDFVQYLPFTFDTTCLYQSSNYQPDASRGQYCSIPARTTEEALSAFAFSVYLSGNREIAIDVLRNLQEKKLVQRNAQTYNAYDAKQLLNEGKSKYGLFSHSGIKPVSDKSFNVSFDASFATIPQNKISNTRRPLIARETALVIPATRQYSNEETQKIIESFLSKEVYEKIITARKTLPALQGFPVVDYKSESVRLYAFSATEYLLPDLLPTTKEEAEELAQQVRLALTSYER